MSDICSLDLIEDSVQSFGNAYSDLVKLGETNEVLDAGIKAFIDSIYRKRISLICNVPASLIDSVLVNQIESGIRYQNMIDNGRFAMFRRNYTDEEIVAIVKRHFARQSQMAYGGIDNSYGNVMSFEQYYNPNNGYQSYFPSEEEQQVETDYQSAQVGPSEVTTEAYDEQVVAAPAPVVAPQPAPAPAPVVAPEPTPVVEAPTAEVVQEPTPVVEAPAVEAAPESAPVVEAPAAEASDSSITLSALDESKVDLTGVVAPQEEQATIVKDDVKEIAAEDLVIPAPVDGKDKMGMLDMKIDELMKKYSDKKFKNELKSAITTLHKKVLSELTGIPAEEIKDFVCDRVYDGTSSTVTDEQGNDVVERRPLTDEEATILVNYINSLSEAEVNELLTVNDTEPEHTMAFAA